MARSRTGILIACGRTVVCRGGGGAGTGLTYGGAGVGVAAQRRYLSAGRKLEWRAPLRMLRQDLRK